MRFLPAVFLCVASAAQSPLVSPFASNYYLASHDGAVYFDLTVHRELRLDRVDVALFSPAGATGSVEVLLRPGGWAGNVGAVGDWARAGAGAITSVGQLQPAACVLSAPIGLPPGNYGVALHVIGVMPAYAFAFGLRSFGNGDLTVVAGGSALQCLAGAPFFPRVFSGALHYTLGGGPFQIASVQRFGEGCRQGARSFHETLLPSAFDLAGQCLRLQPNAAGGYDVTRSASPSIVLGPGAHNLGLARQGTAFVALPQPLPFPGGITSVLRVHAEGCVGLTDAGRLQPLPQMASAAELFAEEAMLAVARGDLEPSGADNVWVATDPVSGRVTVVWWNVAESGAPARRGTFACVVHADGAIDLVYGAVVDCAQERVVGFGGGLGARDPGPRDLSHGGAFATQADDPGLSLDAQGRPLLGGVMLLRVLDRPAATAATALLFGWNPLSPGLDLGAFGAPGCGLHVEPAGAVWVGLGASGTLPFAVPPGAGLLGLSCCAQAAALPIHPAPLVTSNGLQFQFGGA